jgi:hypothetical protein
MDENKPCQGCEDKVPGCQDHCTKPAYIRFRERNETIRRNRARKRQLDEYQIGEMYKNRRGR